MEVPPPSCKGCPHTFLILALFNLAVIFFQIPDDPYADSLLSSKPQLLCKPCASNVTGKKIALSRK